MNEIFLKAAVKEQIQKITDGEFTLIIIDSLGGLHHFKNRGVRDLLDVYQNNPSILLGGVVIDKVIGKAAASLSVLGGAGAVYGRVMSRAGRELLEENGIASHFEVMTDAILNRTGDGICPIEKAALYCADALEAYKSIVETLKKLINK